MTTLLGFLGTVATAVVLLVVLAGCAAHVSRPSALPDALRAHRTLPDRAVPLAAGAVTLAEGLLGAAGVAALLSGHRLGLTIVLTAAAALFSCYALYTRHTLASGRGGPCGCSRTEVPLSNWVVGRASAFALLALVAAVSVAGPGSAPKDAAEATTAALTALTFAALLWVLPAAMAQPAAPAGAGTTGMAGTGISGRTGRRGHQPWTS